MRKIVMGVENVIQEIKAGREEAPLTSADSPSPPSVKRFWTAQRYSGSEDEAWTELPRYGWPKLYLRGDSERVEARAEISRFLTSDYVVATEHEPRGMFICGGIGVGKTTVMALIAKNLIQNFHCAPFFISTGTLFTKFFFEKGRESADMFMCANLLFLDDIGREYGAEFPTAMFENFIEYRYANCLPTFITSNLTIDDLRKRPMFERIADRINDPKWMVHLTMAGQTKRVR